VIFTTYGELYESGVKSYKYAVDLKWQPALRGTGTQLIGLAREYAWYVHEGTRNKYATARGFTDDVSDMKFSFSDNIGKALLSRVQTALSALNAN
jgi:hypothetical protein